VQKSVLGVNPYGLWLNANGARRLAAHPKIVSRMKKQRHALCITHEKVDRPIFQE